jgi:hypothetical protein
MAPSKKHVHGGGEEGSVGADAPAHGRAPEEGKLTDDVARAWFSQEVLNKPAEQVKSNALQLLRVALTEDPPLGFIFQTLPSTLASFDLLLTIPTLPDEAAQEYVNLLVQGLHFHIDAAFRQRLPMLVRWYTVELKFEAYDTGSLKVHFNGFVRRAYAVGASESKKAGLFAVASFLIALPSAVDSGIKLAGADAQKAICVYVPQSNVTITVNNITNYYIAHNQPVPPQVPTTQLKRPASNEASPLPDTSAKKPMKAKNGAAQRAKGVNRATRK